jgi:hypothetical protein
MASDVGVGPFLPGEARGRDVDGGFLELLLGDGVVDPNVLEAELRRGSYPAAEPREYLRRWRYTAEGRMERF